MASHPYSFGSCRGERLGLQDYLQYLHSRINLALQRWKSLIITAQHTKAWSGWESGRGVTLAYVGAKEAPSVSHPIQ